MHQTQTTRKWHERVAVRIMPWFVGAATVLTLGVIVLLAFAFGVYVLALIGAFWLATLPFRLFGGWKKLIRHGAK